MHESLRLWALCNAMKWNHLPVAGGMYDQHPKFLDDCMTIFQAQGLQRKKDAEKQKAQMKGKGRKR